MTWTPKKLAVFRKVNLTVEFSVAMSVGTPVVSVPAWITKLLNLIVYKQKKNTESDLIRSMRSEAK